ncbi:hypothetical protein [Nostoc sp. ChiQUE01b]|uniref:hypothetical protein n=1 Tax=Nostoc sp. ChiQUE01b TaxID=3075376 RepID=UPI002AD5381A|nr:hypothetical protein [Nostoc sp. ChiQUE01b]MDZ8257634.1 hypothetical protein [Nostoc sp. ChiQUE01b]
MIRAADQTTFEPMENDDMQINTIPTQSNLSVLLKMEAAINAHDIKVPGSLAVHKLIYRGATYYKLSHQAITFLVNAY